MHPLLAAKVLRPAKTRDSSPHSDIAARDVDAASLPEVGLGERIAECLRSVDCTPEEAAQARQEHEERYGR